MKIIAKKDIANLQFDDWNYYFHSEFDLEGYFLNIDILQVIFDLFKTNHSVYNNNLVEKFSISKRNKYCHDFYFPLFNGYLNVGINFDAKKHFFTSLPDSFASKFSKSIENQKLSYLEISFRFNPDRATTSPDTTIEFRYAPLFELISSNFMESHIYAEFFDDNADQLIVFAKGMDGINGFNPEKFILVPQRSLSIEEDGELNEYFYELPVVLLKDKRFSDSFSYVSSIDWCESFFLAPPDNYPDGDGIENIQLKIKQEITIAAYMFGEHNYEVIEYGPDKDHPGRQYSVTYQALDTA